MSELHDAFWDDAADTRPSTAHLDEDTSSRDARTVAQMLGASPPADFGARERWAPHRSVQEQLAALMEAVAADLRMPFEPGRTRHPHTMPSGRGSAS